MYLAARDATGSIRRASDRRSFPTVGETALAARAVRSCQPRLVNRRAGTTKLTREPSARQPPVAHHGLRRDAKGLGCFVDAQAAKEPQLDHLRASRVEARQARQGIVERTELRRAVGRWCRKPVEIDVGGVRDLLELSAAFGSPLGTRGVDENPPHDPRRHRKEVSSVLPLQLANVHQPKIRLVHERGRLERMAGALPSHVTAGEPTELVVDERRELIERRLVAAAPGAEQPGNPGWALHVLTRGIVGFRARSR